MERRALGAADFDRFVAGLDYPMFVVTTSDGAERSGCLVGFTTQTSIDPPRFLVCLSEKNHTYRIARGAEFLAVHRLGDDQHALAEVFGGETGDETDKFTAVRWRPGPERVPVLEDCPTYLVGRILERRRMGDHAGFLLEPVALDERTEDDAHDAGEPLTLCDVDDVDPGHQP